MKTESNFILRKYNWQLDEDKLLKMIEEEDGWDYADSSMVDKYKKALKTSITFVAYQGDTICGYSRSLDDGGIYIYVCDLLVKKLFRGKNLGRYLMECLYEYYPDQLVYVMSDVDGYYEKVGYKRIGSIYEVPF
jgi:GNAT superfamily N-acetyltransferase